MTTSTNKRKSFLYGCLFYGCLPLLVLALVSALPIYWFCFHTTPLRISEETTFVLGPMTSDGKRIDYFRAMEERYYPPEMKTDDNGYRLIVRAMGVNIDNEVLRLQVYEKLGLDPNEEPTMKLESLWTIISQYDKDHPPAEGEQKLWDKFHSATHSVFNDFPMLKDWLEENMAGIDLLAEAVRKPAFYIPYVRENENSPAFESLLRSDNVHIIREWARVVRARATYRLGVGDIDGAIDDIVTAHHLARHAGKQGTLVSGLIGIAVEGMAYSIGIGSNPEFPPTKEQIERLIAELDSLPPRWTFNEALESERLFGLAALQDIYWGNNPGMNEPFPYFRLLFPNMGWTFDINIALTKQNKVYDAMTGITDDKMLEKFFEPSGNPYNPLPLLFTRSRTHRIMNSLMELLVPSVQAGREAWHRIECTENMQRLTLALLLYEIDNGKLPEGDWREAIRPYLGENADRYFRCPSHRLAEGETNYAMIGNVPNAIASPQQILVVEIMQPQRLGEGDGRIEFERAQASRVAIREEDTDVGSNHPGGINVGLRSGAVRFITQSINPEV